MNVSYLENLRDLGLTDKQIGEIQELNDSWLEDSHEYSTNNVTYCDCEDCDEYDIDNDRKDMYSSQRFFLKTEGFIQ